MRPRIKKAWTAFAVFVLWMLFNDNSGALCRCNGSTWDIVFDEGSGNCT